MIGTVEGYLVSLSLVLPIVFPLEYPNTESDLPGMLLGKPLGLWFGSEAVGYLCFFCRFTYLFKATFWGVSISCIHPYRALIKSSMNSLRYYQIMELITLSPSSTWLIFFSWWRQIADELESCGSMLFTLIMDEDSSRLTPELLGWVNLLGPLVVWDSPSLSVWINLLQYFSGIGIVCETVGLLLGS